MTLQSWFMFIDIVRRNYRNNCVCVGSTEEADIEG